MNNAEQESEICRCKMEVSHEIHKTYSQREISKWGICTSCCLKSQKFTVWRLLEICQKEPDCIINMYKSRTSSEKCLPDLICGPKPAVLEAQTEPPKQLEKATSASLNLGDSKYHYLMVDGYTNVAVPFDSETMKIDSNTWICEKMTDKEGDITYVCKKIQTQEIQELTSPVTEKSASKVGFVSGVRKETKESAASISSKRTEKRRSISSKITVTRRSIHTFLSNLRNRSRQNKEKKLQKLTFKDEPSVILLRKSQSTPTRKGRWNNTDHEMSFLKFVVEKQKGLQRDESGSMVVPSTTGGGVCRPIVRLCNSIKARLRRKRDERRSTHVIKIIYMDDDEISLYPGTELKHTDAFVM